MKRSLIIILLLGLFCSVFAQNKGKAFLLSLAVPGYSQINSGRGYGYAMLAAEAAIIGSKLYLESESKLKREESYTYALKFSHISPGMYDDTFFLNVGKYESSGFDADGYNASVRIKAQDIYPDNPVAQQQYIDDHAYGEDKYWRWDSSSNRSEYNKMRNTASNLKDYSRITVGVIILNHLISGIDVLRFHSQERRAQFSVLMQDDTPLLNLSYKF